MLKQLLIKNIAIIEHLELGFRQGLTVITGESGSGKSILLDAISLAFGAKASPKDVLRANAERGQVELVFDIGAHGEHEALIEFLNQYGVSLPEDESEILLSREFTPGGSRSRINGVPVTRDVLEALRPWVIDLHGQHELTSLFQKDKQRQYLDAFGGPDLVSLKRQVAQGYEEWQALRQQLQALKDQQQASLQQRDFMQFQLTELEEANLAGETEDVEARQEMDVLSHAEKLIQSSLQGVALLSEGDNQQSSAMDLLSKVEKKLAEGAGYDPALEAILGRLNGVQAELKELAGDLNRYHERVEVNPERMDTLGDRLDLLEKLKRKYGPLLGDVIEKRNQLRMELESLDASEKNFEALEKAVSDKEDALKVVSLKLGKARKKLAEELKARLLEQLEVLAMPSVQFDVQINPVGYSREGTEEIEFLFSANPGEPLKPLAKVASGGELSRFLLAMKVLTAQSDGRLTLVFDEIDTGISGPTAKAVAEKLGDLSRRLQVLAITHQPMIAAMGHQHLHVEKDVVVGPRGEEAVSVDVLILDENEDRRLKVLSRLVSGVDTSDEAVERFIVRLREQARAFYLEDQLHRSVGG